VYRAAGDGGTGKEYAMPFSRFTGFPLVPILALLVLPASGLAADSPGPEDVLRILVQANENKDLAAMSQWMAHDADIVNYTIEGRTYESWDAFARDMQQEFASAAKIESPIRLLRVWQRGDVAWFAMELDYIRYVGEGAQQARMLLPLRETGVLERRRGQWTLVTWHESFRSEASVTAVTDGDSFGPRF
jgi:hypothetical protein